MSDDGGAPLLLVLVGTDHHRFDRLVNWTSQWARSRPGSAHVIVQHGTSSPACGLESHDYFAHHTLTALLDQADVVVCHGGPTTIAEARRRGLVPIVVARDPARGEHVDGHQQRFTRRLGQAGLVRPADDQATLVGLIDEALGARAGTCATPSGGDVAATCANFSAAVDALLGTPRSPGWGMSRVVEISRRAVRRRSTTPSSAVGCNHV